MILCRVRSWVHVNQNERQVTAMGRHKAALLLTLGLLMIFTITFPNTVKATTSVYTMTAFTNTSESNMYIYESYNAKHYGLLKGPAYTPPAADLIRDPSIMKHTDGLYYVVYTTNWSGNTVGIASSPDKMNGRLSAILRCLLQPRLPIPGHRNGSKTRTAV